MTSVFIVNPTAGRGLTRHIWPKIEGELPPEHEVLLTDAPGHGTELARQAARQGADRVIAVGGDGTATEVALGLLGSGVVMGHIPTGAGCDLATSVGLPKDPMQALRALDTLTPTDLDVGLSGEDHAFLTVSGVGFDARVAEEDSRARTDGMRGSLPYLKAILKVLVSYRPTPVRITLDGAEALEGRALLVAVANCQYYAGGMRIAPYATPSDGLLDVVVVGNLSLVGTLALLPRMFSAGHRGHPKVAFYQAASVRIESDPPLKSHLNGELFHETPVDFTVVPKGLTFLAGGVPAPMRRPG